MVWGWREFLVILGIARKLFRSQEAALYMDYDYDYETDDAGSVDE